MSHLNFNLDRLIHRVHRRSSEPDSNGGLSLSSISPASQTRNRARSLSIMSNPESSNVSRSASKSVTRKSTKELIKEETDQVLSRKLMSILKDLGLQHPIPLSNTHGSTGSTTHSKSVKLYVANSNDCVYLAPASSTSFTYEDVENGGMPQNNLANSFNEEVGGLDLSETSETNNPYTQQTPRNLIDKLETFSSPSYLCSKIDSDVPIPHTFAVIVELNRDAAIKHMKIDFSSISNIMWPSGDPYNKTFNKEKFKIGHLEWFKSLSSADYFINHVNSSEMKSADLNPENLAERTRFYRLQGASKDSTSSDGPTDFEMDESYMKSFKDSEVQVYKAGFYVFILPILLPQHIPPTIVSVNGSLTHLLNITLIKVSDKLNRKIKISSSYNLPMVRTPPSFANSIADKPIYVNRVWNDSLHYIITFPKKYVALGNEHVINVKLVPLVKDVIIKRIKFNVLERITYVSKDMKREYDYDGDDPYLLRLASESSKVRERVICVCELKTKNKATSSYNEPYKEEVIKCPNNNLLFSCYEPENKNPDADPLSRDSDDGNYMIASPLDINIALPFLTTKTDKIYQNSVEEEMKSLRNTAMSNPTSRKASIMTPSNSLNNTNDANPSLPPSSPIIGALETNLIHGDEMNEDEIEFLTPDSTALMHEISRNHFKENIHYGFTTVGKALYPDSNYRHVQIHHRLQVCFRISKPDPKDNFRMHHYEVVVDTPLILLSSKCNEEAIQLPKYDDLDVVPHSRPPPQTSISFRTPKYSKDDNSSESLPTNTVSNGTIQGNGFSISPYLNQEDTLPSFEEATSGLASPMVRSISVPDDPLSRAASIIPDCPAPAYEYSENVSPATIDQIVGGKQGDLRRESSLGASRVRASLVNSFAPAESISQSSSGNSELIALDDEADSSSVGSKDPSQSSSLGAPSVSQESSETQPSSDSIYSANGAALAGYTALSANNPVPSPTQFTDSEEVEDSSQTQTETSTTINIIPSEHNDLPDEPQNDDTSSVTSTLSHNSKTLEQDAGLAAHINDSEVALDTENSATQDVGPFEQRIPLLRNASSTMTLSMSKTPFDPKKASTDTLSILQENKQQDIYHAYQ